MKKELTTEVISTMAFQDWELLTGYTQWNVMRNLQVKVKRLKASLRRISEDSDRLKITVEEAIGKKSLKGE